MLIEQIDRVDAEPPQRSIDRRTNPLRTAGEAIHLPVLDVPSELRGDDHALALTAQRAPEQLLIRERPVHLRRIEQRHTEIDGAMDRGDRLLLIRLAIRLAHAHATEAEGGDLE